MIRRAEFTDVSRLVEIFEGAKVFMRACGNLSQWADGYPAREDFLRDISSGNFYVLEVDGVVEAGFALVPSPEPTYEHIDGAWLTDGDYVTIHRIASSGAVRGVFDMAVDFAFSSHDVVRVDTHRDNEPMKRAIMRRGFSYCGVIYLANGDERLAYEIVKHA